MDKEFSIKITFYVIALCVFIFSIYILLYPILNPHYFYTLDYPGDNQPEFCVPDWKPIYYANGTRYFDIKYENLTKFIPSQEHEYFCDPNGTNSQEPILECKDTYKFEDKKYYNVLYVKSYYRDCYIYNLPEDEPYIKEKNKFLYWCVTNQFIIFLIYIFIFIAFDLYRFKYKKKSYINTIYKKLSD